MKLLSLFGSPIREGISSSLHEIFLKPLAAAGAEIERVDVYGTRIEPCIACGFCRDIPECVLRDGMDRLYEGLRSCDAITISSPVFFSCLPGPLKNLIDRCQLFWEESRRDARQRPSRIGSLILTSGSDYPQIFDSGVRVIRHFFRSAGFSLSEDCSFFLANVDSRGKKTDDLSGRLLEKGEILLNLTRNAGKK